MKLVKIGLLAGVLLAGVLLIGLTVYQRQTHNRQIALDNEWQQTTGTTTPDLLRNYPLQEKNEAAKKLEELAAQLLKADGKKNVSNVFESDFDRFAKPHSGESSQPDELSANLKTYLATHQTDFQTLYDFIEQNPAPQWQMNLEQRTSETLSFVFHNDLHRLIALDALDKTLQGNDEQALRAFAASWKIAESLRERPELIVQFFNFVIADTQLQTLRQLNRVPREWQNRIFEKDYRRVGLQTMQLEYSVAHSSAFIPQSVWQRGQNQADWRHFLATRVLPVFETGQRLDFSAAGVKTVAHLQQTDFCSFDRRFPGYDDNSSGARFFARPIYLNLTDKWQDYAELAYNLELTKQVLRVKQFAGAPDELTQEKSNLCQDSQWTITAASDGSLVIEFSRAAELLQNAETPPTYTVVKTAR